MKVFHERVVRVTFNNFLIDSCCVCVLLSLETKNNIDSFFFTSYMNDESDAFWHCICVVSENKINTNGKNVHGCTIIRLKQQMLDKV